MLSLFADFIANDRPIVVHFDGGWYFPIFANYPETAFGGVFPTEADYRDPEVQKLIDAKGWMVWPLIPFSYNTINYICRAPHRRRRHMSTGSAPTTRAATCWRA